MYCFITIQKTKAPNLFRDKLHRLVISFKNLQKVDPFNLKYYPTFILNMKRNYLKDFFKFHIYFIPKPLYSYSFG